MSKNLGYDGIVARLKSRSRTEEEQMELVLSKNQSSLAETINSFSLKIFCKLESRIMIGQL